MQKTPVFHKQTNNLATHAESHASAVSLLKSGEQRYIKAINKQAPFFPPLHQSSSVTLAGQNSSKQRDFNQTYLHSLEP